MTASLRQTQDDLSDYASRLRDCVAKALDEYASEIGKFAYRHSKRSQASLIHDYMVDAIQAEFADASGIAFSTKRNLFTGNFFNKYLIKLKKHDRRLRTRNIPTQLVLDWLEQKQLELPGMPTEATKLHLGYQPGATLSASKIWLTCPDGSALDWKWELAGEEPIELPSQPSPKPKPVRPRVVNPAAEQVQADEPAG